LSGVLGYGSGDEIEIFDELPVRHSLGGMYAEFTHRIGFSTNQEGKTMGLAPYGTDKFYRVLREQLKGEGSEFNLRNLKSLWARRFRSQKVAYALPDFISFLDTFERRKKGDPLTQEHKDLAYAVQKLTEDVMVQLADVLYERTGSKNLVIAGGVGLNCVANYQVKIRSKFENIWVHPNPGDNGLAVGQALYAYTVQGGNKRKYVETHDYLGMEYSEERFDSAVHALEARDDLKITKYVDVEDLYESMAGHIASGKVTSWCQGRSEFGPRALGNRSILADPRNPNMKDILNARVKFREPFRPFTPSVLAERSAEFFELDEESPFMLMAPYVRPGMADLVPAITHADNTARVQTVTAETNEMYYGLIKAFERLTGIPMVLDTSFNIADEPIVESPEDAIRCFLSTDIDVLGVGQYMITKLQKTHTTRMVS
jgi:carbamoyltransferase